MTEITLNHITKIEGHATLTLKIENGKVTTCELGSIEGSRYFEGMLVGRMYHEANEITSRICGICSAAHVLSATMAIERALNIQCSPQTVELRKLLALAERIRSHATHLYFLALPDYLGYESALAMLPKYKKEVGAALRMMKVGNEMTRIVGGRDLHPVSITIGGFLKVPKKQELLMLMRQLEGIKSDALATCELFLGLKFPDMTLPGATWFSLTDPVQYAIIDGSVASGNEHFAPQQFHDFFKEYHEEYSTANFVVRDGKTYFVGALARINNSRGKLYTDARNMLDRSGILFPSTNPYANNICQAVELVHSIDHAIQICRDLNVQQEEPVKYAIKSGHGIHVTEAPRGLNWHEYTIDDKGLITQANIVTPTAQNLRSMNDDIRRLLSPELLRKSKDEVVLEVEKLIRNYDPCFSCSTHFLKVKWL